MRWIIAILGLGLLAACEPTSREVGVAAGTGGTAAHVGATTGNVAVGVSTNGRGSSSVAVGAGSGGIAFGAGSFRGRHGGIGMRM